MKSSSAAESLRSALSRFQERLGRYSEVTRASLPAIIFDPAAIVFPESFLWGLAWVCAILVVLIDCMGRKVRDDFDATHGMTPARALIWGVKREARRFHEFASQCMVRLGRIRPTDFDVHLNASPVVRSLIESRQSIVIATAHFGREPSFFTIADPLFADRDVHTVSAIPPDRVVNAQTKRIRAQLLLAGEALRTWSDGRIHVHYHGGAFMALLKALRSPGAIAWLNVDTHWKGGRSSFSRSFAGMSHWTFSTGAARLARLAACPVVLALPRMNGRRGVELQIVGPYQSSAPAGEEWDKDITNQMLDDIEREIGRRPLDYALDLGRDRRWSPEHDAWIPREESH